MKPGHVARRPGHEQWSDIMDKEINIKIEADEITAGTIAPAEKEEQNCGNCRFWREGAECRKYAPKVIATTTVDPHFGHILEEVTVFPMVNVDCWCGQWEPKTE